MHTVLPPGALGSYTPGAHPMISEGGSERSYSEQVASRPDARAYLKYTSTAGKVGTITLQVATADSNCTSCTR